MYIRWQKYYSWISTKFLPRSYFYTGDKTNGSLYWQMDAATWQAWRSYLFHRLYNTGDIQKHLSFHVFS